MQAVATALAGTNPGQDIVKRLKKSLTHFDPDGAEVVTVSELSHVRYTHLRAVIWLPDWLAAQAKALMP